MGKSLDWVREDPKTGRLLYRRAYPARLRCHLPGFRQGQRELKVPLGSRREMTEEAFRLYAQAKRQFAEDVRRAKAAYGLAEKAAAGAVDVLNPQTIAYLVAAWKSDGLGLDAEVRWLERPRDVKLRAHKAAAEHASVDLAEALQLRALGDISAIVDDWGDAAATFAASEGVRVDPTATEFPLYVRAFHDAQIDTWEVILRRLKGEDVPTPPLPVRPEPAARSDARKRTVSDLVDDYKAAKWGAWSNSSRAAVEPVFRVLRDTLGDRLVSSVDRAAAREVLELVKGLPARLGRRKELEGLAVPAAVAEGRRLGLETIGPGTINRGYMVHISAIWAWGVREDLADKNPFTGLAVADPVDPRDKRDALALPQLRQLFASTPWAGPFPHGAAKPGRYWVPLLALFTGMRLGEAAGLRIMDVEEVDGIVALRVRPYEGRSLKNAESRRDLPVHSHLKAIGFLDFVTHRRAVAAAGDLLFPDGKANNRQQWGAKLGEWFVGHLKSLGLQGTKLGMHSFRHGFEDRLRPAELHGRPEGQALAGRAVSGSEGDYGHGFTLQQLSAALEKVTYPGLDLSHLVPPPTTPKP